jgi:DNA-binding transcriptional regulator YhcF (GntR family)/ABC-type glycerol-3-phosphate transport system substrate-binding protein
MLLKSLDKIDLIEEKIINEIHQEGLKPHDRLLSERKLAERFGVIRMQVRQATIRLVEKKKLYTKRGNGTYVAETFYLDDSLQSPHADTSHGEYDSFFLSNFKHVGLSLPLPEHSRQGAAWRRVIEEFKKNYPFIDIDISYDCPVQKSNSEVIISYPHELRHHYDRVIDLNGLDLNFNRKDFSGRILDTGKFGEQLRGVPILRTVPVLYLNMDVLTKYKIRPDAFVKPIDPMRIGAEIEQKENMITAGCRYLGSIFHGGLYGLDFSKITSKDLGKSGMLTNFLKETGEFIKKHHFMPHHKSGYQAFINGEYAIYPSFNNFYNEVNDSGLNYCAVKLPLLENGFICEGLFMGSIDKDCKNTEEASLLISYLCSEEAQQIFVEDLPHFLSVRKDVLESQKQQNSPALEGVRFEFDMRGISPQLALGKVQRNYETFNTEAGKYFSGFQSLEKTLKRLTDFIKTS